MIVGTEQLIISYTADIGKEQSDQLVSRYKLYSQYLQLSANELSVSPRDL